ncbi:hypothetical protein [Sphingomonas sp.]|uniref:hypothetical protein n=1 Tax=Sphingomonas sp. TaxID=28214 RepID=UPI0025DDADE8|nr:hypothetical protein [Sphingomonas sp.]MBV9528531.1 hypothetical protein [Sphingomonas sp.]
MAEHGHTIIIRPEAFGCGFDVLIDPPISYARYDQERPTLRAARRYAESLKVVTGFPIRDNNGDTA